MNLNFRKVGSFSFLELEEYYSNKELNIFMDKNGNELTNDDLEEWAVWINSPWSQNHEKYKIKCNCKDAYTKIEENIPTWECEYSIVGYDGIESSVIGYGFTEEESLIECKKLFKYLQDNFNKEEKSC